MPGNLLKLSESQTLVIGRSTADALEIVSTWEPSTKPPPMHWHPRQHEHFEVLSGQLTVELGGAEPRLVGDGEHVDVSPRTAHRMWNAGPGQASARWTITPALRTEELFRYIDQGLGGLRKVLLLAKFRNEFRIGSPRA